MVLFTNFMNFINSHSLIRKNHVLFGFYSIYLSCVYPYFNAHNYQQYESINWFM